MQHKAQRVGVFVDVQNMYYSARALYDQRVDFGEILKEAIGDRDLVRAFAYVIQADHDDEKTFFDALQERGFELRTKELLSFYGGNKKGDWDVGIAIDVVQMLPKLDAIVLVSGDGDFADLLRYVQSRGVRADVMSFGSSTSSALREQADALLDLSADTKRFLIPKKRGRSSATQTAKTRSAAATLVEAPERPTVQTPPSTVSTPPPVIKPNRPTVPNTPKNTPRRRIPRIVT